MSMTAIATCKQDLGRTDTTHELAVRHAGRTVSFRCRTTDGVCAEMRTAPDHNIAGPLTASVLRTAPIVLATLGTVAEVHGAMPCTGTSRGEGECRLAPPDPVDDQQSSLMCRLRRQTGTTSSAKQPPTLARADRKSRELAHAADLGKLPARNPRAKPAAELLRPPLTEQEVEWVNSSIHSLQRSGVTLDTRTCAPELIPAPVRA